MTYGPPDSLSSLLLCKRFFAEIAEVTNVIKAQDELYQLGVGTTHSGGTRGMAMLEGLVAAVEVRHVRVAHYQLIHSFVFSVIRYTHFFI